jgi:hypothetical protein
MELFVDIYIPQRIRNYMEYIISILETGWSHVPQWLKRILASLKRYIIKLALILKALAIDFAIAFGSVFVSVAIFYSFDVPSEWKIPNILIPIIAVFVYRVIGRMLANPIKKFKDAGK